MSLLNVIFEAQPAFAQADEALLSDDKMIEHGYAEEISSSNELPGHVDVLLRR
mgnify:CR=1 FL=1